MRVFVGIPLPEDLRDRLEELAAGLRFGRAVPAENMHITLAFLDEQPEELLADLHEELSGLYLSAHEIAIDGLDLFGGDKPRLLFAAVRPNEALSDLHKKVRQAARAAGIELSHKRFRPHVTLRRFQRLGFGERDELERFLTQQGAFHVPAFRAASVEMVQSHLTHEGALYETLASYPLGQ